MNSFYKNLIKKINNRTINIAIIGIGYVGIKLALAFAKKKIKVYCYDNDLNKIKLLSKGKSPYSYIKDTEIKNVIKNLNLTNDLKQINKIDAIIFCLPTPLKKKQA